MGFKFDDGGLKKFQKDLEKMAKKAQELDGEHRVPFDQLFNEKFMRKYTSFNDFDSFLSAGFDNIETEEDFEKIPDEKMDAHVKATTRFDTWEEMLEEATREWIANQLGF